MSEEAKLSQDGRPINTLVARATKPLAVIAADLSLLVSVTLAHLIVWRTLRRRYNERAARRKNLKLLRGEGSLIEAEPNVGRGFGGRPRAIVNSSGGSTPEQ